MKKGFIILLLITILFLSGCSIREHYSNKNVAENLAKDYLEEKYGINPDDLVIFKTDLDTISHGQYNFEPDYTGWATIKLSYQDDDFKVVVNYKTKDKSSFYDSYQGKSILRDLEKVYQQHLGISSSYIYAPEKFVLNQINNIKYNNNISNYISKLDKDNKYLVVLLTTDPVNISSIQRIAYMYENIRIVLYLVESYQDISILYNLYERDDIIDSIEYHYPNYLEKYDCTSDNCVTK